MRRDDVPPHLKNKKIQDNYMKLTTEQYFRYDYWCWDNYFTASEIKEINKIIKKNIIRKENPNMAATGPNNKKIKKLKTEIVSISVISKFVKPLMEEIHYCNNKNFQYDLHTNSALNDMANYNTYSSKTKSEYRWHTDNSIDIRFDWKFTVLINLSEQKYTGGDFKIANNEPYTVDRFKKPGSVLMIKSALNHCVTPVLSGERITLTIPVFGPKWR